MKVNLRILYGSAVLQMKQSFSRSMFRFCMIVYPLLYGFTMHMIYKGGLESDFISYVALGSAISSLWGTISFSSAGDINRERFMGALEVIFNAPAPFILIMLGKVIVNTVLGLVSMVVSIGFAFILSGRVMAIQHPILFLATVFMGMVSFAAIAMMLSGLLAISRSTRILMNIMDYPIMILCGMAFPLSMLPDWCIPLSYSLSPTHFLYLARSAWIGIESWPLFLNHSIWLFLLIIIYSIFTVMIYRIIDVKARIHATLGVI